MKILTGDISFTKEVIVFEDYIIQWKNKDIIYCYYGYGGWREPNYNIDTFKFEYPTSEMKWKDDKNYEAKIIDITKESMLIELKENGYQFRIYPEDFRNNHKWDFDIAEL